MENPIKIKLIELAKSILRESNTMDLVEICTKAQKLYENAVIASYLQKSIKDITTSETENTPKKDIEVYPKKEIEKIIKNTEEEEKEKTTPKPTKEYLEDLLSDVSAEIIFEDKRESEKKKSLNDNFTKSTKIGLNDRIAFVKHLFDGNETAFYNTLKKVDEAPTVASALQFVKFQIKPQYNDWKGKEAYEERFMGWLVNKFD